MNRLLSNMLPFQTTGLMVYRETQAEQGHLILMDWDKKKKGEKRLKTGKFWRRGEKMRQLQECLTGSKVLFSWRSARVQRGFKKPQVYTNMEKPNC